MSKRNKITLLLAGSLLLLGALAYVFAPAEKGGMGAFQSFSQKGCQTSVSSTTPDYLTAGAASTTVTCYTARADRLDLNVYYDASTTPSGQLQWEYEFSRNGSEWYSQDGNTVASETSVTHGALPVIHTWTPAVASSTKNIEVSTVASPYIRIKFSANTTNGALYVNGVLRERVD